jgi:hypothetical protein
LTGIGIAEFFNQRYEQAAATLLGSLQELPTYATTYRFLASCYAHMGRLEEAENRRAPPRLHDRHIGELFPNPQFRPSRALSVGPALGNGRDDMNQTRRLAAILAADAAGYSRLMGVTRGVARSSEQRMRFMETYPSAAAAGLRLLSVNGGAIRD